MSSEHTGKDKKSLEARKAKAALEMGRFVETIAALRDPVDGCPWDLEQTHTSLRRFMLEEAYEATEAMLGDSSAHLREELGDVLLQVVLNAQLLVEAGHGDLGDVISGINEKMIRRHPHVFNKQKVSVAEVRKNWDEIKQKEKADAASELKVGQAEESIFKKAKKVNPALTQAYHIGKVAKSIAFDWDTGFEVLEQLRLEIAELEVEMKRADASKVAEELSDVFFSLAQLSRKLGYEPEDIAHRGNLKFLDRFSKIEVLAKEKGLDVKTCGRVKLEELWLEAKKLK